MFNFQEELQQTMVDVIKCTVPGYTCQRGPRPSGAMLQIPLNECGDLYIIYGHVIPPDGSPSCEEVGCMIEDGHCVRNNHAEVDALLKAARGGMGTAGAIMFSINKPCYACTRAIIAAGVFTVYYAFAVYDEERTRAIIEASGLEVVHVPVPSDILQ